MGIKMKKKIIGCLSGIVVFTLIGCATIKVEKINPDGSKLKGTYTRLGNQNLDDISIEEGNGTSKIKIGKQESNKNEDLIGKFIEFLKNLKNQGVFMGK